MSTNKHIEAICAVITVLALIVTALFMNGEALGIEKITDEDAERNSDSAYFTANDLDGGWATDGATVITLTGDGAQIDGTGAYAYDGGAVIANGGRYVVRGTLTDGTLTVDAYRSSKVWILLDGVSITCADDACILVEQADKVFLTLADGSENTLVSGETFSADAVSALRDGAIFSRDDLTINGGGALTVSAAYKHGIVGYDDLVIAGGTISVTAAGDAIRANDSLRIRGAEITAEAGDDALVADNEGAYLYVESGALDLAGGGDAIHAAGEITLAGGTLAIRAGDDAIRSDAAVTVTDGTIRIAECYEGIEAVTVEIAGGETSIVSADNGVNANGGAAEARIRISGGTLTIVNETGRDADGLDSNGDIEITGGTVRIFLAGSGGNCAIDCGSESGGTATITGGTVIACGSSAMAENFAAESTQGAVLWNLTETAAAGSAIRVLDENGAELLTGEAACAFTSVLVSCPQMAQGGTYRIAVGGTEETVTLTETVATLGQSGFGGQGGFGGAPFGENETEDGASDGETRPHRGFGGGQRTEDGERGSFTPPEGEPPEGFTPPEGEPPEGMEPPEGFTPPEGEEFTPSEGDGKAV